MPLPPNPFEEAPQEAPQGLPPNPWDAPPLDAQAVAGDPLAAALEGPTSQDLVQGLESQYVSPRVADYPTGAPPVFASDLNPPPSFWDMVSDVAVYGIPDPRPAERRLLEPGRVEPGSGPEVPEGFGGGLPTLADFNPRGDYIRTPTAESARTPEGRGVAELTIMPREVEAPRRGAGPGGIQVDTRTATVQGNDPSLVTREQATFDAAMASQMTAAEVEALPLEQQAEVYAWRAEQQLNTAETMEQMNREFVQRREQQLQQLQAMNYELMNRQMDPNRFYSARGPAAQFGAALAVSLGALGSALTGGENGALRIISDAVDRDLAAQQNDLARAQQGIGQARNLYADLVELTGDQQQAELAFLDLRMGQAESDLARIASSGASQSVIARANLLRDQLANQRANIDLQRNRSLYQSVRTETARTAVQRAAIANRTAADLERGYYGEGASPAGREDAPLPRPERAAPGGRGRAGTGTPRTGARAAAPSTTGRPQTAPNGIPYRVYEGRGRPNIRSAGRPATEAGNGQGVFWAPIPMDREGNPLPQTGEVGDILANRLTVKVGEEYRPIVVRQWWTGSPTGDVGDTPTLMQRDGRWYQAVEENHYIQGVGTSPIDLHEVEARSRDERDRIPLADGLFVAEPGSWARLRPSRRDEIRQEMGGLSRAYRALALLNNRRQAVGFFGRFIGEEGQEINAREVQAMIGVLNSAGLGVPSDEERRMIQALTTEGGAEFIVSTLTDRARGRLSALASGLYEQMRTLAIEAGATEQRNTGARVRENSRSLTGD